MIKSIKIVVFSFVFLFIFTSSIFANSEIIVEKNGKVTNYYAKQDPIRYAQSIIKMSDKDKEKLYKYAKKHPNKVKPITYIALADYIYETSKEDALFWYFVGRIRSTVDVMMCTDDSNNQQIAYYPLLATKTMNFFATNDKQEVSKIMKKAIEWDIAHPKRINPKWACYHGIQIFITGNVTTKPMKEYKAIQDEYRSYLLDSLNENE